MKKFDDLTFSDHYMFEKVLQNKEICKEILERLLKINITNIEYPEIEKEISPYYETKGVRLDVYVKDKDEVFDIELQNFMDVSIPLRSRYYQSILDMDNLIKGEYYSELPTSYIIFICSFDPFYKELPMYTFTTQCEEDNTLIFEDKIIKKVFNAKAYTKEKDVIMSDFYYGSSFILDAVYRDSSKIRNVLATNLWNDISNDFTNVDMNFEYVEFFINNEY